MQHSEPSNARTESHLRLLFAVFLAVGAVGCGDDASSPSDAGPDAAQAGTGGTGGTGGDAGDAGLTGTRCDNGVGAGGDGCGETFGGLPGFVVEPDPFATGHAPGGVVTVRAQSLFTIPDEVLDTLENHVTLHRAADDSLVDVVEEWESVVSWQAHDASITLTPAGDLTEGWYKVRVVGTLDTGHGTRSGIPEVGTDEHESLFRVGSAPFVRGVENCTADLAISVSEPVVWPATLPFQISAQGNAVTCTRVVEDGQENEPDTHLALTCAGLDTWQSLSIQVNAGIQSANGVALRNFDGDTEFTITMAPFGTGGGCRALEPFTEPPAF